MAKKVRILTMSEKAFHHDLPKVTRDILRKMCVVCKDNNTGQVKLTFHGVKIETTTKNDYRIKTKLKRRSHVIIPGNLVLSLV